jgi:putative transposase
MGKGMTRDKAMEITSMTRHQFYYKPTGGKRGRKASATTGRQLAAVVEQVSNNAVVGVMQQVNADPDTKCGYKRMCAVLMLMGYVINRKKVQRLMRENALLEPKIRRSGKTYARYRIVTPKGPLEVLEMDIKYVWVDGARRNAFILTVIDTFTRVVLHRQVGFTMRSAQVKRAWEEVISTHLQEHDMLNRKIVIEIRNDNGPQFASKMIQDFFQENYLNQVFTHPYTPQENGHIESFHSILANALEPSYWSLEDLEKRLDKFYDAYNNIRVHSSAAYLPPQMFWNAWNHGLVEMIQLPKKRVRFKLKCSYQNLSDIMSQREHLAPLNCAKHADLTNERGPTNAAPANTQKPSAYQSPSVTSCNAKIFNKNQLI